MAKHFEITIRVAYDEAHGFLDNMESQLETNVRHCIERNGLFTDGGLNPVVEEWSVKVEDVTVFSSYIPDIRNYDACYSGTPQHIFSEIMRKMQQAVQGGEETFYDVTDALRDEYSDYGFGDSEGRYYLSDVWDVCFRQETNPWR